MSQKAQIEIGQRDKLFNLSEALELLPLVQSLTQQHQLELAPMQRRLSKTLSNDPRRAAFEQEFEQLVSKWKNKIELLGLQVTALWSVEFNVGSGAISWRHPELALMYYRHADMDYSERINLHEYIDAHDPDWAS